MNILIVGKGGREHALVWKIKQSNLVKNIFCAPGNPGIGEIAELVNISENNIEELALFAEKAGIDLTIVGPESSLELGIVDKFKEKGLKIFGPTKVASQIETSKDFAKKIMKKYSIPTADSKTFEIYEDAKKYVFEKGTPIVIKEDGLKSGKGVTVANDIEEAILALEVAFKIKKNKVVIEEYLEGIEFSFIAMVNEDIVIPLETAQDHKRVFDGDKGLNTGGMGACSPVKNIDKKTIEEITKNIMELTAQAMIKENIPFTGFLFAGIMLTKDGPKVIEFNARLGDPEAEVILPRLESDLIQVLLKLISKEKIELLWTPLSTAGIVLAAKGYPIDPIVGEEIIIKEKLNSYLFHMGTKKEENILKINGGRVLIVVKKDITMKKAVENAYLELEKIECKNLFYRKDIGRKIIEF